jgi:two-component system sensor histidine kinase/response regulator
MESSLKSSQHRKRECCTETPKIWDQPAALECLGGDESLLREVIQIFLTESPWLVGQMEQALPLDNRAQIELAAHSLRGGLGYLGATEVGNVAQRLEIAGRSGEMEDAAELFIDLHTRLIELWAGLREYTSTGA